MVRNAHINLFRVVLALSSIAGFVLKLIENHCGHTSTQGETSDLRGADVSEQTVETHKSEGRGSMQQRLPLGDTRDMVAPNGTSPGTCRNLRLDGYTTGHH